MTRRDFILKWLLYAFALLPILLLEVYVFAWFPIFGFIPTLLPIAAIVLAMLEGPIAGAGFGLFVGFLSDALTPGMPGAMIFCLALLGYVAGLTSRYGIRQNMLGCLICSAGALFVINLLRMIYSLLRGSASLWSLISVAFPEILISLIFLPLIYGIFLWIFRRVPHVSVL